MNSHDGAVIDGHAVDAARPLQHLRNRNKRANDRQRPAEINIVAAMPPNIEIVFGQPSKPWIVTRDFVASDNIVQADDQ